MHACIVSCGITQSAVSHSATYCAYDRLALPQAQRPSITTKHGEQHFVPHGFQTVRKAWTGVESFGACCWTKCMALIRQHVVYKDSLLICFQAREGHQYADAIHHWSHIQCHTGGRADNRNQRIWRLLTIRSRGAVSNHLVATICTVNFAAADHSHSSMTAASTAPAVSHQALLICRSNTTVSPIRLLHSFSLLHQSMSHSIL